jgi:hypothetical protein
MKLALLRILALAIPFVALTSARAQDNYEIQVYGSDTVPPASTMVELHSNFTADGSKTVVDGMLPTNHAEHETVEITQGINSWFETGFYIFTSIQPNDGWQWAGDHIRPRFRIPESWHWPVGVSVSTEVGFQGRRYSEDTWNWEIRPIVDKQIGPWYVAFNPALEKSLRGLNAGRGFEFAPAFAVKCDVTPKLTAGLEYYGGLGPLSRFDPAGEQVHKIFPSIDLNITPEWEFNAGVGFGVTKATDRLILKAIVGRRLRLR